MVLMKETGSKVEIAVTARIKYFLLKVHIRDLRLLTKIIEFSIES